jgi:hypothetical protein
LQPVFQAAVHDLAVQRDDEAAQQRFIHGTLKADFAPGLLGELLLRGFGTVCTVIIVLSVLVLLGLFIAGITPKTVFIYIAYKIRFSGEKRRENREINKEKRKNAKPTRSKVREEEYLAYLDAMNRSGDRIVYKDNGAEIIL